MQIEELKLKNFRNYRELTLCPHPGVNLFFGRNGSGKTNLLEAIHYCSLGRSHRVTNDVNVVKNNETFALSSVAIAKTTWEIISLNLFCWIFTTEPVFIGLISGYSAGFITARELRFFMQRIVADL